MRRYLIECLDTDGRTARSFEVACRNLDEAQARAPRSQEEAVFIRPIPKEGQDNAAIEALG